MPTYIWSPGAVRNVRVLEGDAEQRISDELIVHILNNNTAAALVDLILYTFPLHGSGATASAESHRLSVPGCSHVEQVLDVRDRGEQPIDGFSLEIRSRQKILASVWGVSWIEDAKGVRQYFDPVHCFRVKELTQTQTGT